ncbi:MAG: PVC-type heme-binding CxxCH protein [Pirellulales bacterium]
MNNHILWLVLCLLPSDTKQLSQPEVLDPRLKIELFAAEPDIVTPCGIAVDGRGRVLAVESQSHFRPTDYQGPPADRIRMFEDTDGDGRADKITNFFEGTTWTMNVGVHPDGSLYVATRSEIFRLRDTNDDAAADERTPIVRLETKGAYPHNGLSGFAFDFEGNVYFGLGENLGAPFKLIGTDGSIASDLEGGQIYRCRPDGSQVRLVAFGFWNPFHLAFDAFGRLFAVDNDPDSLPPCRLMHIVAGGNYGYRYRNGRKGVHPFTAWNGELPGTLPMVAGTGEAPSGIVAYESDHLPADYVGDLLVTSWGDHRIERYRLVPRGASFRAVPEAIVAGDENFRPVGIAVAPDGSLYVTDWVKRDYELHGKGRIWHITAPGVKGSDRPRSDSPKAAIRAAHRPLREQAARQLAADRDAGPEFLAKLAAGDPAPRVRTVALAALRSVGIVEPIAKAALADPSADVRAAAVRCLGEGTNLPELLAAGQPAEVRAEAMRRAADPGVADVLWNHVADSDAFVAQAARQGLARLRVVSADVNLKGMSAARRLACLLILRESRDPRAAELLPIFLRDPDSAVRFSAVQWVGEERVTGMREPLVEALSAGPATARLFGGYLAAMERLDGVTRAPSDEWAGQQYMARALEDPRTSAEVRRFALRMLRPDHPVLSIQRLRQFLGGDDRSLQLEAVRTLRDSRHRKRGELLSEIASATDDPLELRAEAIVGLSPDDSKTRALLVSLAGDKEPVLRHEALRSLRGGTLDRTEREELARIAGLDAPTAELVHRVLQPDSAESTPAAEDVEAWIRALRGPTGRIEGDRRAGERIFFHQKSAACSRCHQIAGRGAQIGPELTAATGVLAEERLIESILRPSKEIAPQFVSWLVVTTAGKSLVGMLVHEEATGEQTYADQHGNLVEFRPLEIETRRPQPTSIMPDGLARQLTIKEFRDLVAFLRSP